MSKRMISIAAAVQALRSDSENAGVFERLLGFATGTGAYKPAHLMNDLAQSVLSGRPGDGDFLCRVIREGKEGEGNEEPALRQDRRHGSDFNRAFPEKLGAVRVSQLRLAARALLTVDDGIYRAGDAMASASATHMGLLGADGFLRFRVGRFVARVLDDAARARLAALYGTTVDPVTRALLPLLQAGEPKAAARAPAPPPLTQLDRELGRGLGQLLAQPLSKPVVLRGLAHAGAFAVLVRILGAGFSDSRPVLLALSQTEGPRPLRQSAIFSARRCFSTLDRRVARALAEEAWPDLTSRRTAAGPTVAVNDGEKGAMAVELVEALKALPDDELYWPETFALSFGRRIGLVHPPHKKRWESYVHIDPEMLEVLALMMVPWGERRAWPLFWREIKERFGVVVGANHVSDAEFLRGGGVASVSHDDLKANAEHLLDVAVGRGIARRLPDGGAEIGGTAE